MDIQLVLEDEDLPKFAEVIVSEISHDEFTTFDRKAINLQKQSKEKSGSNFISHLNEYQPAEEDGTPVISSYMKVARAMKKGNLGFGI
jgi:hypothetical protein